MRPGCKDGEQEQLLAKPRATEIDGSIPVNTDGVALIANGENRSVRRVCGRCTSWSNSCAANAATGRCPATARGPAQFVRRARNCVGDDRRCDNAVHLILSGNDRFRW